ncbi:hypothetical protein [Pseudobutyrivibrio ruminis]|uniref:hypothetical protein n=1 Tax=Pseudobutyrivibrio ruminis TaxID=46206 RepID=UPI000C1230CD|nr:hypothetical protein [Pseudobutyrivibrio ruminis]
MRFNKSRIISFFVFFIGYALLFLPFVFSVYYTMPANDDYAWALKWWSDNRFIETFERVRWNYMNCYGNSGLLAIVIQVLINPLYLFDNAGHSMGIYMIVADVIIFSGIILSFRKIYQNLFEIEAGLQLNLITFFTTAILATTYYYNDVYNWWSGMPGYSFGMLLGLATIAKLTKYFNTKKTKDYVAMIILGVLACTNMMFDVFVGATYVLLVFVFNKAKGDKLIKKVMPLVAFIISGVIQVIAPGNYGRMDRFDLERQGIGTSIYITFFRVVQRFLLTLKGKPWTLLFFLIILSLGLYYGTKKNIRLVNIILGAFVTIFSAFGGVILYVFGQDKGIDTEFATRINFFSDYITFIGMAIVTFAIGCWIKQKFNVMLKKSVLLVAVTGITLGLGALTLLTGKYNEIIQINIIQRADVIRESYYFWNEIIDEVIAAEDGADVVIKRENVDWCPYSYYTSFDDSVLPALTEEEKYGTCNQCASLYYDVNSIVVILD